MKGLSEIIHDKLNLDFESFVNGINDETKFNDFKNRLTILENKKNTSIKLDLSVKIEEIPEPITEKKEISIKFLSEKNEGTFNQKKEKAKIPTNQGEEKPQFIEIQSKNIQNSTKMINPALEQLESNELILSLHPKTEADL